MKKLISLVILCWLVVILSPGTNAQWGGAEIQQLTDNSVPDGVIGLYIDSTDRLHLLCAGAGPPEDPDTKLFYRTKTKGGNWTQAQDMHVPSDVFAPITRKLITFDPRTGIIHIIYTPYLGGFKKLYYTNSGIPGWEFVVVDSLSGDHNPEFCWMSAAFDPMDNVHLAWHVDFDSIGYSWYRVMYGNNSTGQWAIQQVSSPIFLGYMGSGDKMPLTVEKHGVAHLMYYSFDYIYHAQNDALGGKAWVPDSLLFPSWWNSGGPSSLAVDDESNLHMCLWGGPWPWDPFSYILYYYRPKDSTSWGEPDTLTDTGIFEKLFIDNQGVPHLSWQRTDGTTVSSDIIYAAKDGTTWSSYQILDEEPYYPTGFQFVIDSEGKGHGAFSGWKYAFNPDSTEIFYFGSTTSVFVENTQDQQKLFEFELFQNYPNPFNQNTMIKYSLNATSPVSVSLKIYNILGKEVRELVNTRQSRGNYQVTWDGEDNSGKEVASGTYFYQLTVRQFGKLTVPSEVEGQAHRPEQSGGRPVNLTETKKLVLVK